MQLYAGSTKDFISDAVQHRVAEKLGDSYYEYFRFRASVSEFASWQNSLTALTAHLQYSNLLDQGIALELQLPLSSARLDALVTGKDARGNDRAVIIELKQWSSARSAEIDDCVVTFLRGREREVAHPSVQARNYVRYLSDMNSAFHESTDSIALEGCCWLHNLDAASRTALLAESFKPILHEIPLFTGQNSDVFESVSR